MTDPEMDGFYRVYAKGRQLTQKNGYSIDPPPATDGSDAPDDDDQDDDSGR